MNMQRYGNQKMTQNNYYRPNYSRTSLSVDQRPLSQSNTYYKPISPDKNYQQPKPIPLTANKYKENKMNLMKSKTSCSSMTQRPNENNLFPEQLLFLLGEEQQNIEYFKERMDSEKKKIERDFSNLQAEIGLLIQDLKLSLQSQLDQVYRDFMNLYRNLKDHVTEMRQFRKTLLHNYPNNYRQHSQSYRSNEYNVRNEYDQPSMQGMSNQQLLLQISNDAEYFKHHQIYQEINTAHRQRLGPILQIANDLIAIGGYEKQYYKQSQTCDLLRNIKGKFQGSLNEVYNCHLENLITQAEVVIQADKKQKEENNIFLKGLNDSKEEIGDYNYISRVEKKTQEMEERHRKSDYNPYGFNINSKPKHQEKRQKKMRPTSSTENLRFQPRLNDTPFNQQNEEIVQSKMVYQSSLTQQNLITQWSQEIQIQQSTRNMSEITAFEPQDNLLCGVFLDKGRQFAVGSKDKNIYIYSLSTGKLVSRLCGHRASVCCLSNHSEFLASGGDVGCSSVILWDTRTWTVRSKIQCHSAAISGIVDLLDDQSLGISSYDKKITIYNYKKGQVIFSIVANKTAVACLAIDSSGKRLISSGLDSQMSIWNVNKKNGKVDSIQLQRNIVSCGLVCSLREVSLHPSYIVVGNKEGKIFLINIKTGDIERRFTVGKNSVIEMAIVERRNKPQTPIVITSCHRQKSLIITKTDSGLNRSHNLKGKLNIEYGCGIGPKLVINGEGIMGVVSQSQSEKQINFYDIQIN